MLRSEGKSIPVFRRLIFVITCLAVLWSQTVGVICAASIAARRETGAGAGQAGDLGVLSSRGDGRAGMDSTAGPFAETFTFQHVYLGGSSYQIHSNYNAVWLSDLISSSPDVIGPGGGQHIHTFGGRIIRPVDDQLTASPRANINPGLLYPVTVTYTAVGGEFNVFRSHEQGVSGEITPMFTLTGTPGEIHEALSNTLFIPYPNFAGNAIVTATSRDSVITIDGGRVVSITSTSPVSRSLAIPVTLYPDYQYPGQYKDFIKSLRSLEEIGELIPGEWAQGHAGSWSALADDETPVISGGIRWDTLEKIGGANVPDGPPQNTVWGDAYKVKTKAGNTFRMFMADPLNNQPPLTKNNPLYVNGDISYNCHGFSFGVHSIRRNGNSYNFALVGAADVKTLLADSYLELTPNDALNEQGSLIYVFYDRNGDPIHSCKTMRPLLVVREGKLVERDCRVFTKNGYEKRDATGLATLQGTKAVYPQTTEIKIYKLKP